MNLLKTILPLLCVGLFACGCQVVPKVERVTAAIDDIGPAIEESTGRVEAIGQAITDTLPAIEAARNNLDEAAQAIAAVPPVVETIAVAVEKAKLAIEVSTGSISENVASVTQSTVSIRHIGDLLQDIEATLDRLAARKMALWITLAGGGVLILIPLLFFLVSLAKLSRAMTVLSSRMQQLQTQTSLHSD